ncbi:MAG: alpha-amylase [Butyrivibrio sp.]|nr:alpha-amylase [Butyrivibrio sp.]
MASTTSKSLRNKVMYQIFPRNFSRSGDFKGIIPQLDRIKDLGVDIVYLTPIHPIGEKARKGSLGSPYAIKDYRAVNPEFGTLEDFRTLVKEIHDRDMDCIIDVVYNHTSPDSVLASEHPEWFYHKKDGSFGNRVGDWTDIIDLDYSDRGLWDYQIETLKIWAKIVDGFRCDVAPLVPIEFWKEARDKVEEVHPGCLWLSESIDPPFIQAMRDIGVLAQSDSEMYQAFDVLYDYDVYQDFTAYVSGKGSLDDYAAAVNRQEYIYPDNYVKLRFLENHDQPRAKFLFPNLRALKNATAFLFFQKGLTFIYAGQEMGMAHLPSLFDKDILDWKAKENVDLTELFMALRSIKSDPLFADSTYRLKTYEANILKGIHSRGDRKCIGIFSMKGEASLVPINAPDGVYKNLIDGSNVEILHGYISICGDPVIINLK